MKKTKDFNNLDVSELKLKKGETKTFRLLKIKKDKTSPTGFYIPSAANVPTRDVINHKGETCDIAAIKSIGIKGSPTFHSLWFTRQSGGQITCTGGRIADQEIYEYLMLSNYRRGNPERDPSLRELYELVDVKGSATARRANRQEKLRAENYALNMTDEDVTTFAAASGWNDTDIDILRDRIEEMAGANPLNFLKIATNRHNNIKADIKKAIDQKIIKWDSTASTFSWASNNELIVTVPRSTKGDHLDGILHFIINVKHGESVYQEIKLLLSGKKTPIVSEIKEEEFIDEVKEVKKQPEPFTPINKRATTKKK